MKRKIIINIALLFIAINTSVYYATQSNAEQRIKLILDKNLETLKTHYKIILKTQDISASTLHQSTINIDRLAPIMLEAKTAAKERKAVLRDELKKLLAFKYERAKQKGVLQYQFVLPNNESFLRMHKPSKFGDDLTDVRDDFKYTNKIKKPIRGFTQGRTAHGFRNTFPIFDANKTYVGVMEISFSSDSFQWFLNHVSNIHTHFLVDKNIFDSNTWARDDLILKYSKSAESSKYMISINTTHSQKRCVDEQSIALRPIQNEINDKLIKGEEFTSYVKYNEDIEVVVFLPVRDLNNKTVAWIVSYEKSEFILLTLKNKKIIRAVFLIFSLILGYFILQQARFKQSIIQRHRLLDDMLNTTEDIMFITDFKEVSFSNIKFKSFFNITYNEEFNKESKNDVFNIFIGTKEYLNKGMLEDGEHPISLIQRTIEEKRIVSVLDKHLDARAFKINILKTNYENNYLVTLSDITQMQVKQMMTEKKAYVDGLTKVYNRNKFDEIVREEITRVRRYSHPLSLAIIDIDKFKNFNDTYGHLIGDEVLIMMAQCVNKHVRETDTFARWGGEEFIVLFPETDAKNARIISEKLRTKIENLSHETAGGITASFGITEFKDDDTLASMFKRCDEALYLAKENGRNRIELI